MSFQAKYDKIIDNLINSLPGKRKFRVSFSSCNIDDIFNIIDDLPDGDMYFLENGDVWRHTSHELEIVNHKKFDDKIVFLHHIGYENKILSDKKYKISFPILYFTRTLEPFYIKSRSLPYGFSCLNNNNQIHRLQLGHKLYQNNLLKDMIFTQQNKYPNPRITHELQEYVTFLPITYVDSDDDFWVNKWDYSIRHDAYHKAYANIVTESDVDCEIVSEKSFKPFISGQIPIMLGPSGHIQYLKDLGFDCMEDLLPTGYDYMDVNQKIQSIVNLVEKGHDYIEDFYFANLDKIKYNHELVSSKKVDDLIIKRITDLL